MTDLTDRMRTCAAYLCGAEKAGDGGLRDFGRAIIDAADLLIEASNTIEEAKLGTVLVDDETAKALGLPMEVMKPWVEDPLPSPPQTGTWIAPGGPLPGLKQSGTISPRACPRCDSRANKTVRRAGSDMMLICPVCAHQWELKR